MANLFVKKAYPRTALVAIVLVVALAVTGHHIRQEQARAALLQKVTLNVPPGTPPECLEGHKMMWTFGGLLDEGNVPPRPGCPGYDPNLNPEVGTFVLGDATYRIPRAYLAIDRYRKDGPIDGLWLMVKYPEMTPGDRHAADRSHNISVLLGPDQCTPDKQCMHPSQAHYHTHLTMVMQGGHIDTAEPDFAANLNLNHFHLTAYGISGNIERDIDVYYQGSRENPTYWLVCSTTKVFVNPSCESVLNVTKSTFIKYEFSRIALSDNQMDIRESLRRKLASFVTAK